MKVYLEGHVTFPHLKDVNILINIISRSIALGHFLLAWVMSISVGLGSTFGLITFMNHIGVDKLGFREGGGENVCDVLSLELNKSIIRSKRQKIIIPSIKVVDHLGNP